jgi:hypothetical protein
MGLGRDYYSSKAVKGRPSFSLIFALMFMVSMVFYIFFNIRGGGDTANTAPSYDNPAGVSESSGSEGRQMVVSDGVFAGNGFSLEYPPELWTAGMGTNEDGEQVPYLRNNATETLLSQGGVSGLSRLDLPNEAKWEEYAEEIYSMLSAIMPASIPGSYVKQETDSFAELNGNIYYAAYAIYNADGSLDTYMYIVASVDDGLVMSFIVSMDGASDFVPNTAVLPLLRSITLTKLEAPELPEREELVWYRGDTIEINGTKLPSLDKIMSGHQISYEKTEPEKASGIVPVRNMFSFFSAPRLMQIEAIEITYTDIDFEEIIDLIEEYRDLLYGYEFFITYQPQSYSAYGKGYYYYELAKRQDDGGYFVGFIYNPLARTIHLQAGFLGGDTSYSEGVGPLDLEKIIQ